MATARQICHLGASEARIYPTVVLKGTALASQMATGEYTPLSCREAVSRAADVLDIFDRAGVRCLRIGLCENEGLRGELCVGGAHHPAMGELVLSEQYFRRMTDALERSGQKLSGAVAEFAAAPGKCSQVIGQGRENLRRLRERYGLDRVRVREDSALTNKEIRLERVIPR